MELLGESVLELDVDLAQGDGGGEASCRYAKG